MGGLSTALAGLILFTCCVLPVLAQPLEIYTEEYPPLTFSQDGRAAGLAVEVVEEILKRLGRKAPIMVVPWARGYNTAIGGRANVVLFTTMRTGQREKLFKWVGPVMTARTNFYANKDSPVVINSLEEAKKLESVGTTKEYYSEQELKRLGFANLDSVERVQLMVKKLLTGRNSVMVSDDVTLPALLELENASMDHVKALYTLMVSPMYIAFSLATPDQEVEQWQAALDGMKRDGTYAKIMKKWLPHRIQGE